MKYIDLCFKALILVAGIVIICLLLTPKNAKYEGEIEVLRDTLIIHDTTYKYITDIKYKYIKTIDTIYIDSTRYTPLVIQSKLYSDSISDIWVSGYQADIDSIKYHLPEKTIYIDKVVEIEKIKPKSWFEDRFVVTAGLGSGYGLITKQPDIYLGFHFGIRLN